MRRACAPQGEASSEGEPASVLAGPRETGERAPRPDAAATLDPARDGGAPAPDEPGTGAAASDGPEAQRPSAAPLRRAAACASAGMATLAARAAEGVREARETIESLRAPEVRVPRGKEQRP